MSDERNEPDEHSQSRREFLKNAGLIAGGLAVGGAGGLAISELVSEDEPSGPTAASGTPTALIDNPTAETDDETAGSASDAPEPALLFLHMWEADILRPMVERIFPADDNGPGATEAGVVTYIDRQLASVWGIGGRWNMSGPFFPKEAADTQGWQYSLTPRDAYRASIRFIQEYSQREYSNDFQSLEPAEQDTIIQALEDGEMDTFRGITPGDFFTLLQDNTLEGMYSDPAWGGNRDMVGWTMKQYPGSYVSYRDQIESEEFIELDPQGIAQGHGGVPHPH